MRWPWQSRADGEAPPGERVADELPSKPYEVFAALARHDVDYVVIGGVAVQAHGNPRTTLDVDLVAAPEPANTDRLAAALTDLQARLRGVDAELIDVDPRDGRDLLEGGNFTLATSAGRVDVWTHPEDLKGCPPWAQLRQRAQRFTVRGTPIDVVGKDDLLSMKRAAGREKDHGDVAALTSAARGHQVPADHPRPPELERSKAPRSRAQRPRTRGRDIDR